MARITPPEVRDAIDAAQLGDLAPSARFCDGIRGDPPRIQPAGNWTPALPPGTWRALALQYIASPFSLAPAPRRV